MLQRGETSAEKHHHRSQWHDGARLSDLNGFANRSSPELGLAEEKTRRWWFVPHDWRPKKSVGTLIDAMTTVVAAHPEAVCVVAGEGSPKRAAAQTDREDISTAT
jgi:hypothetical protein